MPTPLPGRRRRRPTAFSSRYEWTAPREGSGLHGSLTRSARRRASRPCRRPVSGSRTVPHRSRRVRGENAVARGLRRYLDGGGSTHAGGHLLRGRGRVGADAVWPRGRGRLQDRGAVRREPRRGQPRPRHPGRQPEYLGVHADLPAARARQRQGRRVRPGPRPTVDRVAERQDVDVLPASGRQVVHGGSRHGRGRRLVPAARPRSRRALEVGAGGGAEHRGRGRPHAGDHPQGAVGAVSLGRLAVLQQHPPGQDIPRRQTRGYLEQARGVGSLHADRVAEGRRDRHEGQPALL